MKPNNPWSIFTYLINSNLIDGNAMSMFSLTHKYMKN